MKASHLPQMTPLEHLAAVLWTSAAMASLTLLVIHTHAALLIQVLLQRLPQEPLVLHYKLVKLVLTHRLIVPVVKFVKITKRKEGYY